MHADIAALKAVVPMLADGDAKFAASLIQQSTRRALTDKQMHWVRKLATRATEPQAAPVEIANVSGVVDLLVRAGKALKKWPKLLVRVNDDITVRLTIAGTNSKVPGSVNVVGSGEARPWYGRISPDGVYQPARDMDATTASAIGAALQAFANDPVGVAAEYGQLTKVCCFCATPLTNKRSTSVGYGPICADKWGLPWGGAESQPEPDSDDLPGFDTSGLTLAYGSTVIHRL